MNSLKQTETQHIETLQKADPVIDLKANLNETKKKTCSTKNTINT